MLSSAANPALHRAVDTAVMRPLGQAQLGASTFYAAAHGHDECGANGLPLTPNSVRILGRFRTLTALKHPRLCKYVDLVRGKHERVTLVFEYYRDNLGSRLSTSSGYSKEPSLVSTANSILSALACLHFNGIVHRNLCADNVLIDAHGQVCLHDYGMYHMTEFGAAVSFPIGLPGYLPPETLLAGPNATDSLNAADASHSSASVPRPVGCNPNVDSWSVGVILLELLTGRKLWKDLTVEHQVMKILNDAKSGRTPLNAVLEDISSLNRFQGCIYSSSNFFFAGLPGRILNRLRLIENTAARLVCRKRRRCHIAPILSDLHWLLELSNEAQELIRACLTLDPRERRKPVDLLRLKVFNSFNKGEQAINGVSAFSIQLNSADLSIEDINEDTLPDDYDHLSERSIDDIYYLWRLAGGDLDTVMRREEQHSCKPSIIMINSFVAADGEQCASERDASRFYDNNVVILPLDQLRERLSVLDACDYYPLIEERHDSTMPMSPGSSNAVSSLPETSRLPLVIKERDVEYQLRRLLLFHRLLTGSPSTRQYILKEARLDVPPRLRGAIWAVLLDIQGDVQARYDSIDKETPKPIDRQIEVDIPRCHQYNELMSSPEAHRKLRRVLKAWVVSHHQYVYWQGLDSLTAPFIYLNFENEALAFACLERFIPKYLHNFFLKDNAAVIQEYLAIFSHLIAFHEPELCNHMEDIGFFPDLYSIPWFLTMYAHVFPLHRLFHLWDMLLLGGPSTPIFVAVAILQQLKLRLLQYGFNECILLFSDLPEIDIEQCVKDTVKVSQATPRSATYRQHGSSVSGDKVAFTGQPQQPAMSTLLNDMVMSPIPLNVLKEERLPRISGDDLLTLLDMRPGKTMAADGSNAALTKVQQPQQAKPRLVVIDIRRHDDFVRGMVAGSVNMPYTTAFTERGDLVPCPAVDILESSRSLVKVVVDSSGRNASAFADRLLKLNYSKVCILHKGMDAIKNSGILTVPTSDL